MLTLSESESDPKLVLAKDQIEALLRRYDIAGIVMLQSETHGEWLYHVHPSWSAAELRMDADGRQMIHFSTPASDARKVDSSTAMLITFRDAADRISAHMELILVQLAKHLAIDHASRETEHLTLPSPSPSPSRHT